MAHKIAEIGDAARLAFPHFHLIFEAKPTQRSMLRICACVCVSHVALLGRVCKRLCVKRFSLAALSVGKIQRLAKTPTRAKGTRAHTKARQGQRKSQRKNGKEKGTVRVGGRRNW